MNKRMLYLEDDQALADITTRTLRKRGYYVEHFASIYAFELKLTTLDPTEGFNYALLDLKLGTETSIDLVKRLAEHFSLAVVILTGYGSIRTAVQAMKLGAVNFLTKPCGVDEIISAFESDDKPSELSVKPDIPEAVLERPSLKNVEWEAIEKALDDNEGNISAAARQLKMHRRTLQRKLLKRRVEPS